MRNMTTLQIEELQHIEPSLATGRNRVWVSYPDGLRITFDDPHDYGRRGGRSVPDRVAAMSEIDEAMCRGIRRTVSGSPC